jgi:hypothetical protein
MVTALLMEAVVRYSIRNNFLLNVVVLIQPVEAINQWRAGS